MGKHRPPDDHPDLFDHDFSGAPEQRVEIARVHSKISACITNFFRERGVGAQFHVDDLRRYVAAHALIAPDSAGRIMRDMRERSWIGYEVVNRRASLYRITSIGEPA